MLHITYNYALQTIQALSCQGYTHSMSPPTMACSAARLFSISVSRGYCPGSTINTFNHVQAKFLATLQQLIASSRSVPNSIVGPIDHARSEQLLALYGNSNFCVLPFRRHLQES